MGAKAAKAAEAATGVCTAKLGGTTFHTKTWSAGMTVDSFLKGSKENGGHYANGRAGNGNYGYFNVKKATAMASNYKYSQTGIQTYKQGTWSGSQAFKIGCTPAKAAKAAKAGAG